MEQSKSPIIAYSQKVLEEVRKAVVGKDEVLLWAFATILAGGHILLEDIPGVGKTTMALAFSKTLGLSYNRIQFNPDVLPSDVTGYSVPDQQTGSLQYRPGAVQCNLLLADELNRATSRTQSALLEAMEEGQVTVDGVSHKLPSPFIVIATQNPTGAAGTQLLPDSQVDRFMVRLSMGYPAPKDEVAMVLSRQKGDPLKTTAAVADVDVLSALRQLVADTHISDEVAQYVVKLVDATRHTETLLRGGSPRATLSVVSLSKAIAQLQGRDYVVPKDVQEVFVRVLDHRVQPAPGQDAPTAELLCAILGTIRPPKLR